MNTIIISHRTLGTQEAHLLARFAYWIGGQLEQFAVTLEMTPNAHPAVTHIWTGRRMCWVTLQPGDDPQRVGFEALRRQLSHYDPQLVLQIIKEAPACPQQ